jgi:hypothetical protein
MLRRPTLGRPLCSDQACIDRLALIEFATRYNETWLVARHNYRTPAQVRAGPKRFSIRRKMAVVARLLRGEPMMFIRGVSSTGRERKPIQPACGTTRPALPTD